VRDVGSDEVLLLMSTGTRSTDPEPMWTGPRFTLRAGGPYCTIESEEDDCNWLDVVQYLQVQTSGVGGQETETLEPFSDTALTIPLASGDAPYRILLGRSVHAGLQRPTRESCAVLRTRGDSFALARVAE
jgi:hypothetical protein